MPRINGYLRIDMIDNRKLLLSFVFGIVFWTGGFITKKFLASYASIIILTVIPIVLGCLLGVLLLRNASLKNIIIYSAISVIVKDIILVIQTINLFFGDEFFVKYLKEMIVSFIYVSPIQLFIITITWFFVFLLLKSRIK